MSETKEKTDYKLLYHELVEKHQGDLERLQEENDVLKSALDKAKKEITSLRHTIGGYITQAARAKKEISNLKADYELAKKSVSDLTKVSLENKAMVKECIMREQETEGKNNEHIAMLDSQILKLTEDLAEQKKHNEDISHQLTFYKGNYEYFISLPWYKRIFAK